VQRRHLSAVVIAPVNKPGNEKLRIVVAGICRSMSWELLAYLLRNLFHNEVAARKFNHFSFLFTDGA